jgi:hypothetical protein
MMNTELDDFDPELDELELLSNSVLDHIQAGNLDAARQACLSWSGASRIRIDWLDRTARVHAARGEVDQAIEHFRRCIEFIGISTPTASTRSAGSRIATRSMP